MDGFLVRLEWLRNHFQPLGTHDASDEEVERAARAYLLYLLGTTIFTSKFGDKVSGSYPHLQCDLTCLDRFAWGATYLAFLYKDLGKASRAGTRPVVGYLTLLEIYLTIYANFSLVMFLDCSILILIVCLFTSMSS
ncbi:hypothetical protein Dimus_039025 [Dionaea muscipula]